MSKDKQTGDAATVESPPKKADYVICRQAIRCDGKLYRAGDSVAKVRDSVFNSMVRGGHVVLKKDFNKPPSPSPVTRKEEEAEALLDRAEKLMEEANTRVANAEEVETKAIAAKEEADAAIAQAKAEQEAAAQAKADAEAVILQAQEAQNAAAEAQADAADTKPAEDEPAESKPAPKGGKKK